MGNNTLSCTGPSLELCGCAAGWMPSFAADVAGCTPLATGATLSMSAETLTTAATTASPDGRASGGGGATQLIVAVALSVGLVVAAALLFAVWYSRRRGTVHTLSISRLIPSRIHDKVRGPARLPPLLVLPASLLPVLPASPSPLPPPQARELFQMQYSSLLLDEDHEKVYKALFVRPAELEVSSDLLGSGQYGYVWRGMLTQGREGTVRRRSRSVAVKVLKSAIFTSAVAAEVDKGEDTAEEQRVVQLLLEARMHAVLRHPNIVQLLGVQAEVHPGMLALALCEAGDLKTCLRQRAADEAADFSPLQRRDMAAQVACGLAYLHRHLCLHRDVAARNVLLTAQLPDDGALTSLPPCGYILKLGDLGLTRMLRGEQYYYLVRGAGAGLEDG